ncbi:MAG: TetR family transcriptional regulator [Actinobacteria bacterium]|nr:TetR family transcriptional regulator [Actinomycetota bacterium]
MSAIEEHPSRPQRADARRNRERVLAAAAELFAEEGCKVQIEQVAHRAGVGVGTVCRNFPTKVDLVDAVVTQGCELLLDEARAALDQADAGAALRRFFVRMADFQTTHRALAEEMSAAIPASAVPVKQALHEAVAELMEKAQGAGAIRSDIGAGDVTMLLSAISHATALTGDPELRDRYISIVLDGLRPHDASPLPGRPVHISEIQKSKPRPR